MLKLSFGFWRFSLALADSDNSDYEHLTTRTLSTEFRITHSTDDGFFGISLPLNFVRQNMHFTSPPLDTLARRHYTTFTPSFNYASWGRNFRFANYSVNVAQPEFATLMPTDDTTNPLAYHANNPNLKASVTHSISLSNSWTVDSLKRTISLGVDAALVQRAWGTRTTYDASTGAYSYRPDNINGNWNAAASFSYQQPIAFRRRLTLSEGTTASYQHSVDFPVAYVASSSYVAFPTQQKSTVHNWTLSNHLKLEYQLNKLTASVSGNIAWRQSTSTRQDFQNINAFDFDYGVAVNYTIPWVKLQLGSDLRMFSRRGYYSKMMNDDHLVWNAELSRSLLKDRLTMKMTAFDLLHQLSNTLYSVNAQGRTETWNNCIPRYVMFALAYKFTQKPKK